MPSVAKSAVRRLVGRRTRCDSPAGRMRLEARRQRPRCRLARPPRRPRPHRAATPTGEIRKLTGNSASRRSSTRRSAALVVLGRRRCRSAAGHADGARRRRGRAASHRPAGHPATALTARRCRPCPCRPGAATSSSISQRAPPSAPVSPESRTPISPRSPAAPTASWCSAAPTGGVRCSPRQTEVGHRVKILRTGGFHCHPRQYGRGAGPGPDLGDRGGCRRHGAGGAACG